MYVETYETSSKWTLFNMRFIAMFITAVCVLFLIKDVDFLELISSREVWNGNIENKSKY